MSKILVRSFFFALASLVIWHGTSGKAQTPPKYQWAIPVHFAAATCTEFSWVSDLPNTDETAALFKRCVVDRFGLPLDKTNFWSDGSNEEFLSWLNGLAEKGRSDSTLIFYFATHQWSNGQTKFSKGPNLEPEKLIQAINKAAKQYRSILFINDSCYAAALEKYGSFSSNIIRFYTSKDNEVSIDLVFDKGPYGLEEFTQKERQFLKSEIQWEPKGMSFFGIIGLKAALALAQRNGTTVDLQALLGEMNRFRDLYDEEIRQAKVQHFVLMPADANIELLRIK